MSKHSLLEPAMLGPLHLTNRVVMAPMTRSRAIGNVPNALMATYYAQRASVGLIISEGTSPSPNGLGYPRIPGCYSPEQEAGWREVVTAVHRAGGRFFVQLMHTGRVSHPLNLPAGAEVVAPSAIAAKDKMHTDSAGPQDLPVPRAMTLADIQKAKDELVHAARTAVAAGADGVELHGANGYLIEQFISASSNQRTDAYGGNIAGRIRFAVEVAQAVMDAIGGARVGMRISPYGANAGMLPYDGVDATYAALTTALAATGMQYLHLVDHSAMGAPAVPQELRATIRKLWPRTLILAGGFDRASAEAAIASGAADLVAFGRPVLANPDFVHKIRDGLALNQPDYGKLYTPGEAGFTDYPTAS